MLPNHKITEYEYKENVKDIARMMYFRGISASTRFITLAVMQLELRGDEVIKFREDVFDLHFRVQKRFDEICTARKELEEGFCNAIER